MNIPRRRCIATNVLRIPADTVPVNVHRRASVPGLSAHDNRKQLQENLNQNGARNIPGLNTMSRDSFLISLLACNGYIRNPHRNKIVNDPCASLLSAFVFCENCIVELVQGCKFLLIHEIKLEKRFSLSNTAVRIIQCLPRLRIKRNVGNLCSNGLIL